LLGRRRESGIDVGQQFRKADAANIVWQVASIFRGVDGKAYAQLIRIDDVSMRKTVAINALTQSVQYVPIASISHR
jgi:hypothetical protein